MDNKEKKDAVNEEYTVQELLERLIADDSWEKDIEVRKRVVGSLAGTFRDC
ncbi:MAG: hypothetical protein IKH67_01525 [Lachnospiraceae bacterium]|nr:hypothetical protein [Lachnospiraceae bacterium]MBR6349026.1 hypothetical protein [Lachnospiraceae bacterium]